MGNGSVVGQFSTSASGYPGYWLPHSRRFSMTHNICAALLLFIAASAFAANENTCSIIPLPQKVQPHDGVFVLKPTTQIRLDADDSASAVATAGFLAERLQKSTGYPFRVNASSKEGPADGEILL